MTRTAHHTAYGVMTEDGLDGTTYTTTQARKDATDLRRMGLSVYILEVTGKFNEDALDAAHELIRDGITLGKARIARLEAAFNVTIKRTH